MGTFVGVLPGSGATTGSMVGYAMQKKFKSEEPMGTGAIEGIAASEAANNAAAAGAFAPLLALGIPGSGTGAVLLGGLMMWGLNPGPLLFDSNPEFCWGLISSMYVANVFTLLVSILAVSYTHLDVYKRQALMRVAVPRRCGPAGLRSSDAAIRSV